MKIKVGLVVLIGFIFMSFGLSKSIDKLVKKNIKEAFQIENFIISPIAINQDVSAGLPSDFGEENFFKISTETQEIGYAYIGEAPSKTDKFTYLVILDKDLIVKKSKVLIYREDYGGEIGSKRWLKQFNGKTMEDTLSYGDNIMAISGATISVKSMTKAVNDLLKSLKILSSRDIL